MTVPKKHWIAVDLSFSGTTTGKIEAVAGVAGRVVLVVCGTNVKPTTGTLALAKGTTNILSATNVNLASLTNGTAAEQTISTVTKNITVAATDVFKATWTLTSAGSFVAGACKVYIEPDIF